MHIFHPKLPLKDNYLRAYDIAYAAWNFAGHEHRTEFRNSGRNQERSAWLTSERLMLLEDALANGQLIALGIAIDDPELGISAIPANLFLVGNSEIDPHAGTVTGLGRKYQKVHVCRVGTSTPSQKGIKKSTGRPSELDLILKSWAALIAENPRFFELSKTKQNMEIREKARRLFPNRFPGECRIGESTIRRHRRNHPELFF